MRYSRDRVDLAVKHLRAADPVLRAVIRRVGPFTLRPQRDRFGMLVRSIISQQISVLAARSIRRRLESLVLPERPSAENLGSLSLEQLRSAGLSPQKSSYLADLCGRVRDGRLDLRTIGRQPDEAVIADLVQVKGIGRWTAQMFLIFALGRLDVLPHDDLGVRAAIRRLYGLAELPDRATSERIARPWRPFASVASWYCWRSIDLARNGDKPEQGYPV
ncbi:MAG TPA: DNA-3-methyladenine glycosylase 2 family protein [Planctomycetaceae bacterium]|nr:DNA-3-methyladenine glycosylase 2 family protein [Planctomycetaceae bacterium]